MPVWVDGSLVAPEDARVSVFDHGFTVGDGVFETLKVVEGTPFALTRHLRRLAASARGLGLPVPDDAEVRAAVAAVLADGPRTARQRLRVTWTAGPAPLGSGRGGAGPTLVVAAGPLDPWPPSTAVVTVPWPRNERGATAGLKTTSYAENVVALSYAAERGAAEAVFANTRGELCEGTGSNVLVAVDGRLVTPPLSSGCLAGVTRALLLEWAPVTEAVLGLDVLARADEVALASTTRDLQPVHGVDGRAVPAPGPLTRAAMAAFAERAATQPDP